MERSTCVSPVLLHTAPQTSFYYRNIVQKGGPRESSRSVLGYLQLAADLYRLER